MIYEFECKRCDYKLEIECKITEIELRKEEIEVTPCPKCEKRTIRKVISKSSFQLNGSCWYKDGYSK